MKDQSRSEQILQGPISNYSLTLHPAFFIDPPYTAAGKKAGQRLYTHHSLDHELLFQVTGGVAGDFLMSYDLADGLIGMANRYGFETRQVAMKNTHHAVMKELLIGRNLSWVQ